MQQEASAAVYFRGFNGVRFLAVSSVIFHHIEQYKSIYGYTDTFIKADEYPVVYQAGRLGVALFFTLSGFLITYLLLAEKRSTGRIHVGNFYVRRILRIWPLYFLLIGLSFFVFPHIPALYIPGVSPYVFDNFWSKLALFGLVMPNIALMLYQEMPFCAHTWSIGVEEQFYLIWPWLIGSLRSRRLRLALVSLIVVSGSTFFWFRYSPGSAAPQIETILPVLSDFLSHFRIGAMAIGGLGAYLVFQKHPLLDVLYLKPVQWVVYAVLAAMLVMGIRVPGLNYECYALFFAFLIVNLAANARSVVNLDNRLFNFMGKISYGLYMYHPVAIVACLYVIRQFIPYTSGFSVLLYITSYGLTTLLAWLSYDYFEKPFLRLKDRFAPEKPAQRMATAPVHNDPPLA